MTKSKERIISAATDLFIRDGYEGASVREICESAGVTINMISYYFGGKEQLYNHIVGSLSEAAFTRPLKILEQTPADKKELRRTLRLFADQTLDGLLANQKVYVLARRERVISPAMSKYQNGVVDFFERAKQACVVREDVDAGMITGLLVGRLADQVEDADWIRDVTGTDIRDSDYRERWVSANLDILINGVVAE